MKLPKIALPAMRNVITARTSINSKGQIMPSQPSCDTGTFTDCMQIPNSNCPGRCEQKCLDVEGIVRTECCPPAICQPPPSECCKQVCCEAKVV